MNLKFYLLVRIILVGLFCLLSTSAYVLYQADQQAKQAAQTMLTSISKQLAMQLQRIDAGYAVAANFPDFHLWQETHPAAGVCLRFNSTAKAISHSVCRDVKWSAQSWPEPFAAAYLWLFNPGLEINSPIIFKNQQQGSISLTLSVEQQLAQAWQSLRTLLTLSILTILAVCLLVYLVIKQALRPAAIIVTGLQKMQAGHLTVRLPDFDILEWRQTATAINDLVSSQQQLLTERQQLSHKLITVQDAERRYLARELHDELGQCLAAISALAASITQTAKQECPVLVDEAENISQINAHMLQSVRDLLVQLRPAEIDELGLEASLQSLISEWNKRTCIVFSLNMTGDCTQLAEPLPMTLFRIIQESLTNISKHSTASKAQVELIIKPEWLALTIADNGCIAELPFVPTAGMGLLGIRERVTALGGQFTLQKNATGGLTIDVKLPHI
ncbi:MAG: two-component system, NarL family, sensor histidine kinase UhpB [Methyloprofundus sp.]|nr:MAG: two-component system, NarL family, sensor histidine kinase UhpB [Methyloprofundus sp.]